MVLKIRLARFGRKHAPIYNIVVAQARSARNSKPIEVIGTYDPIPKTDPLAADNTRFKDIRLDTARAQYWLGVGAQPSDPAWRLLSMRGLLEPKYQKQGVVNKIIPKDQQWGVVNEIRRKMKMTKMTKAESIEEVASDID